MTPDEAYRYATGRCARAELCRADLRPKLLARGLAPADADALRFYRALARLGRHALPPGGRLYAELNQALGPQTADLFRAWGYTAVELRRDQFGHDRMVKAVAPDSFPLQTLTP